MGAQRLGLETGLISIDCGGCGGTYAINRRYHDHKEERGGYWTCPYCRISWGFGESLIDKERKQTERERLRAEKLQKEKEWAQQEIRNVEQRLRAQKGATTRAKNTLARTKAGVCPCCNRTFKQLAAHMQRKHPNWNPKEK